MATAYGKMGADDQKVIDAYLRRLPDPTVVLNLGCGPFESVLHNLGRTLAQQSRRQCTLILADAAETFPDSLGLFFVPGRVKTVKKRVNAFDLGETLGAKSIDLILALGLFGALDYWPTSGASPRPTEDFLHTRVLEQCYTVLRPQGILLISNSSERQPQPLFKLRAEAVGFVTEHTVESRAIRGAHSPNELRYLLALRRRGTP